MKVCTDSCLFGAWIAQYLSEKNTASMQVLDIGTGTGLLSLMVAQNVEMAVINAVEIDNNAAKQATENFAASPWKNRLHLINGDVKNMNGANQYDAIISNPPFYENDVKSMEKGRNLAFHSEALTISNLISVVEKLLKPEGIFAVLIPMHRKGELAGALVKKGFFLQEQILVRQTENHAYFRAFMVFSQSEDPTITSELCIKQNGAYSPEFVALLKNYYLIF